MKRTTKTQSKAIGTLSIKKQENEEKEVRKIKKHPKARTCKGGRSKNIRGQSIYIKLI
jgi:hypothetical protein